ncbi:MAG: pseudouridine synthase [Haloplasmataceae bacterium]|jgi:23S rRNA pseudouridine1911/1915/1917 synthase|nr:pseudouridine synthase [Haloplasmataceae bacterium]
MAVGNQNNIKLNVLYEDNHIIVVIKPVGVLSQADETNDIDMLTIIKQYLKEKYQKPGNVFLGLVHRLDRMVSGVMVFAKTSKAASRISEEIRTHNFQKNYLAVVHGKTCTNETLINYLLKDEKTNTVSVVNKDINNAKMAELSYQLIDFKNELSLVKIDLKTGRPHQIRVQMSHINHPLYGDKKYGVNNDRENIALFAYKLAFNHPVSKELMVYEAKPEYIYPFNLFNYLV